MTRPEILAQRLTTGVGLLIGTVAGLGVFHVAQFIAARWNPFL